MSFNSEFGAGDREAINGTKRRLSESSLAKIKQRGTSSTNNTVNCDLCELSCKSCIGVVTNYKLQPLRSNIVSSHCVYESSASSSRESKDWTGLKLFAEFCRAFGSSATIRRSAGWNHCSFLLLRLPFIVVVVVLVTSNDFYHERCPAASEENSCRRVIGERNKIEADQPRQRRAEDIGRFFERAGFVRCHRAPFSNGIGLSGTHTTDAKHTAPLFLQMYLKNAGEKPLSKILA